MATLRTALMDFPIDHVQFYRSQFLKWETGENKAQHPLRTGEGLKYQAWFT